MTTKMSPWVPTTNLMELRRLGKTIEELGELVAVLGRSVCQGLDGVDPSSGNTNLHNIEREQADVLAQMELNVGAFKLNAEFMGRRVAEKQRQMHEWEALFWPPVPAV